MSTELLNIVAEEYKEVRAKHPSFGPGDTINVHYKIKEGNKERVQQFQGTVMMINNKKKAPTPTPINTFVLSCFLLINNCYNQTGTQ